MHITIEQNVEYLKRYAFLERACMRALAGWLPGVPEWEAKNEFGLHVWEASEAADTIYGRLRELRCHSPERGLSAGLLMLGRELDYAGNSGELIAAVYLVVRKALLAAYRSHPESTWSDFDRPTVKLTEQVIPAIERQVKWAEQFFETIKANYPGWEAWREYTAGLLAADGGVTGDGEKSAAPQRPADHPLLLPWLTCQREAGWPIFNPDADFEPDRKAEPEAHRLWRFKHYLNEMTAAETLGSILWMTPEMTWEYQHNVARHLWDEMRHSQLGQIRVQQLGLKIADVPQVVQIYNVMMKLPAVEQYALLTTVIEPNGMPEKVANREHWEEIEDEISAAAVSYDWSDENFHVRWGQKWTPVLLKTYGYPETPKEIADRMEAWLLENTPVKMQQKMAVEAHKDQIMPKVMRASRATEQHTRVNDASHILKRFYVAERQLMRITAGWFVKTSQWDMKFALAGEQWQAVQHADSLRTRVLELRYPRRDVDKKYDGEVMAFMAEVAKGADVREFLAGVYEVVLPALVDAYTEYLNRADPLDDAPTVYRLQHIVGDEQRQMGTMRALISRVMPGESAPAWCDYLRRYLDSIGGLNGLGAKSEKPTEHADRPDFQAPRQTRRDERFKPMHFHLPHENKYDKAGQTAWKRIEALDKRVAMQVWSAISHFNEIWAAEVPASVMYELSTEPWDFYLDLSRWMWDEARHSMMGYRAMQGWGWDVPALIPYGNALYNALAHMPAAQRLALLYYFEEGLLRSGTKQTEIQILESARDDGSIQDMDYDWADEAIHVGYGFKWLRHLLGDDTAGQAELKRLTDEARAVLAEFVRAHQDDPEAKLAPFFDRLYDVVARMTFDIPDDGLDIRWAPVVADEEVLQEL